MAVFRQHTSRSMDPQLHTHAVIAAKVQDPTGRWLSLDARFLKQQQRTIGWVYDAALRAGLTARLGVAWEPVEGGQADIVHIGEEARTEFSRRSTQVDEKLVELIRSWSAEHRADPDPRTIASSNAAPSSPHGRARSTVSTPPPSTRSGRRVPLLSVSTSIGCSRTSSSRPSRSACRTRR